MKPDKQRTPLQRSREKQRVLALVGTDVHPFARLVAWLERWFTGRSAQVRLRVQYGTCPAPSLPDAVPFLDHDELLQAIHESDAVVCHGGPATITEVRRLGLLPLVVPRDPAFGEHVDSHQLQFSKRLSDAGLVRLCMTEEELVAALDTGLDNAASLRVAKDVASESARAAAALAVGRIVDDLVAARPKRRRHAPS